MEVPCLLATLDHNIGFFTGVEEAVTLELVLRTKSGFFWCCVFYLHFEVVLNGNHSACCSYSCYGLLFMEVMLGCVSERKLMVKFR